MRIKDIEISFLGHAGFAFTTESGKTIVIDPYNVSDKTPKADIILITHPHYDHCSVKDIQKLAKPGATVLIPADAQSKITKIDNVDMQTIEVGEEILQGAIKIETVAAYNVGKDFHPKREGWMGYLIKYKDVIVYHSGDTDKIPEMDKLTGYGKHKNHFVVLLPVSGTYVMNPEEAAHVASLLSPDLAIPMHYGAGVAGTKEDAEEFVRLCAEKNIKAMVLEKK